MTTDREALLEIAEIVAAKVSTRFMDGNPLANRIEVVLSNNGIKFWDDQGGVRVRRNDD